MVLSMNKSAIEQLVEALAQKKRAFVWDIFYSHVIVLS